MIRFYTSPQFRTRRILHRPGVYGNIEWIFHLCWVRVIRYREDLR